jgi:thiol-disulfide isomerase/thioredoxin
MLIPVQLKYTHPRNYHLSKIINMKKLIIALTITILAGCFGAEPQKTGKEGKLIPEFTLLLTDSTTQLQSRNIPNDKPIVFFYFSPYCPYCKAQTKEIIENMEKLKGINFYFISNFALTDVKNFCEEYQLKKYPNITTGLDTARTISTYFEITAVPYIAILGKNKLLNKTFIGKVSSSELTKSFKE